MAPRRSRAAPRGAAPRPQPRPRLAVLLIALALMVCRTPPLIAAASKGDSAAAWYKQPWVGSAIVDPFEDLGGLDELRDGVDYRPQLEAACARWRRDHGLRRGDLCRDLAEGRFSCALRGFARWLGGEGKGVPEGEARALLAMTIHAAAHAVHDDGLDDEASDLLAGTDEKVSVFRVTIQRRFANNGVLACCLPRSCRGGSAQARASV